MLTDFACYMLLGEGGSVVEAGVLGEVAPFLAVLVLGEGQGAFECLSLEMEPQLTPLRPLQSLPH